MERPIHCLGCEILLGVALGDTVEEILSSVASLREVLDNKCPACGRVLLESVVQ